MTNTSLLTRQIDHIESESWWFVWLGIAFLWGGAVSIIGPMLARAPTALTIGGALVFIGVLQLIHAWLVRNWSGVTWQVLIALVILVGGVVLLINPIVAAVGVKLPLGIMFIVIGVLQTLLGNNYRPNGNWGWMVVAGILAIVLGALILLSWPTALYTWETSAAWAPGLPAAISLLFTGWSYLMMGASAMRLADREESEATQH